MSTKSTYAVHSVGNGWQCDLYRDGKIVKSIIFTDKGAAVATGIDFIEIGLETDDLFLTRNNNVF